MRAKLRRSVVLACLGLLCGFALVVTLYGAGEALKRFAAPDAPRGVAALPPGGADSGARPDPQAGAPGVESGGPADKAAKPDGAKDAAAAPSAVAPTFDIIRIEPDGETVIAGRGAPNTTVELLRDGQPIGRALIDPSGQFAIVPPALPAGASEIALRSIGAGGQGPLSKETVAVVVAPGRDAKPLIALAAPDKPTVILSQPDPAAPPPARATPPPTETMAAREPVAAAKANTSADRPAADKPGSAKQAAAPPSPDTRSAEASGSKPAEIKPADAKSSDSRVADSKAPDAAASGPSPAAPRSADAKPVSPKPVPPKPADAKPAQKPATIVSVDSEEGGRLYVTSQAPPGATVRLYLNDALVAPGSAGADGRVTFTIGRGVQPGDYRVRVDQVDPVTGSVKSRSEVPFSVPAVAARVAARDKPAAPAQAQAQAPAQAPAVEASRPAEAPRAPPAAIPPMAALPAAKAPPSEAATDAPAPKAESPVASATPPAEAAPRADAPAMAAVAGKPEPAEAPRAVFVPEINTTLIARGDNLWQISRRVYGKGLRYTVIFDANQPQIRDPDLIYPGQIFVLPAAGAASAVEGDKRG